MSPKRLRLIARIIAENAFRDRSTCCALAQELDRHADELETLGWTVEPPREIRIKEPLPVTFSPMEREDEFPRAQRGRR